MKPLAGIAGLSFRSITLVALVSLTHFAAAQSEGRPLMNFREVTSASLGLYEGDQPVFVYNHGLIAKEIPSYRPRANFFHPVHGLDGEILTDDAPADHRAHRGLYWGWPHVKIGEQEYDSWGIRGIRYQHEKWTAREEGIDSATLAAENGWFVDEKQIMREEMKVTTHKADEQGRFIDIELTWTPNEPITLWGAEGKSYGGLVFRFAPRKESIITTQQSRQVIASPNLRGQSTEGDLTVTKLPWVDLTGNFGERTTPSGAAVFVHPTHPDFPPEWMARAYGILAVGWPGVNPQTLEAGKAVTVKYRVWIHRGAPTAEEAQKVYDAYAKVATSPIESASAR